MPKLPMPKASSKKKPSRRARKRASPEIPAEESVNKRQATVGPADDNIEALINAEMVQPALGAEAAAQAQETVYFPPTEDGEERKDMRPYLLGAFNQITARVQGSVMASKTAKKGNLFVNVYSHPGRTPTGMVTVWKIELLDNGAGSGKMGLAQTDRNILALTSERRKLIFKTGLRFADESDHKVGVYGTHRGEGPLTTKNQYHYHDTANIRQFKPGAVLSIPQRVLQEDDNFVEAWEARLAVMGLNDQHGLIDAHEKALLSVEAIILGSVPMVCTRNMSIDMQYRVNAGQDRSTKFASLWHAELMEHDAYPTELSVELAKVAEIEDEEESVLKDILHGLLRARSIFFRTYQITFMKTLQAEAMNASNKLIGDILDKMWGREEAFSVDMEKASVDALLVVARDFGVKLKATVDYDIEDIHEKVNAILKEEGKMEMQMNSLKQRVQNKAHDLFCANREATIFGRNEESPLKNSGSHYSGSVMVLDHAAWAMRPEELLALNHRMGNTDLTLDALKAQKRFEEKKMGKTTHDERIFRLNELMADVDTAVDGFWAKNPDQPLPPTLLGMSEGVKEVRGLMEENLAAFEEQKRNPHSKKKKVDLKNTYNLPTYQPLPILGPTGVVLNGGPTTQTPNPAAAIKPGDATVVHFTPHFYRNSEQRIQMKLRPWAIQILWRSQGKFGNADRAREVGMGVGKVDRPKFAQVW